MSGGAALARKLSDADWFLDNLDFEAGRASFVQTDRASLASEPFLDHRWAHEGAAGFQVPLSELLAIDHGPAPLSFIWHTSYCASTLLASCLDAEGRCLALKEPRVLVLLAALKRTAGRIDPALARAVFSLLARRFRPDEQILIKPSNGANTLMVEAAAMTSGRMLLLHSDCESYLVSMARQGGQGFSLVREMFLCLASDGHPAGRWPPAHVLKLTDLQLAGLVWRMQMDALEAASQRLGDRARSLDFRRFLADPGPTLRAADDFLGLHLGPARIEERVNGPLFTHNAKQPLDRFDRQARADEDQHWRTRIRREIDAVIEMTHAAFPRAPKLAPPLELEPKAEAASPEPQRFSAAPPA